MSYKFKKPEHLIHYTKNFHIKHTFNASSINSTLTIVNQKFSITADEFQKHRSSTDFLLLSAPKTDNRMNKLFPVINYSQEHRERVSTVDTCLLNFWEYALFLEVST